MDLDKIQSLMHSFERSDIRELKIDEGNFHLYLSKNGNKQVIPEEVKHDNSSSEKNIKGQAEKEDGSELGMQEKTQSGVVLIKAPVTGTISLQSDQDENPYVKVGLRVERGAKIASIKAFKKEISVESNISGTVTAINVKNGDLVQKGETLIAVEVDRKQNVAN